MNRFFFPFVFFCLAWSALSGQCDGFRGILQVDDNSAVGHSFTRTGDGGYLLGGVTSNFGSGGLDWLVTKLDANMQPVYSKAIGWASDDTGSNAIIEEFSDQTFVLAGYRSLGSRVAIVSKFTANGDILWSSQLDVSGATPRDVDETSDGGIVVSGTVQVGTSISDDIFVMKFSADGDMLWGHRFDSSAGNEHIYGTVIDSQGFIYLVGNTEGFAGTHRGFSMKIDEAGTLLEQKVFNSGNFSTFVDVALIDNDELLISGFENIGGNRYGVLIKTDLDFNIQWQKQVSYSTTTTAASVEVDLLGRIVAGFTNTGGGQNFLSIAEVSFATGDLINSVATQDGENVSAQIITNIFQSGPQGDVGFVSSTGFSLYSFDSCLESDCQSTPEVEVVDANFSQQDYNIPLFTLPVFTNTSPNVVDIAVGMISQCEPDFSFDVSVNGECVGEEFVFELVNVSNPEQIVSVSWSISGFGDSSESPTLVLVENPGMVFWDLLVTTITGDEITESGSIEAFSAPGPESFDLPFDELLCAGETFSVDFPASGFEIIGPFGSEISSFETGIGGSYTFTAQNACGSVSHTLLLEFLDVNPTQIPNSQSICPSIDTLRIGFTDLAYSYLWDNGSVAPSILVSESGNYQVQVSLGDCSEVYNFSIADILPIDLTLFPNDDVVVCSEGGRTLILPNLGIPFTFADGTEGFTYVVEASELLELSFTDGCYDYNKSVNIVLIDCLCPIFVPNAFTPDEDGLNDIFKPVVDCPVEEYKLQIFNRLGMLVFESRDVHFGWNGQSLNEDFYTENELYLYRITYGQRLDGLLVPAELSGHVTLLR